STKPTWAPPSRRSGPGSRGSTPSSSETCFSRTFAPIGSVRWRGSACGDSFRSGCAIPARWPTTSFGWGTAPCSCAWTPHSSRASSRAGSSTPTCSTTSRQTLIRAGRTASSTPSCTQGRGCASLCGTSGAGSSYVTAASYIVTLWRPLPDETTRLPGAHPCDRLQRRARAEELGGAGDWRGQRERPDPVGHLRHRLHGDDAELADGQRHATHDRRPWARVRGPTRGG